MAAFWLTLSELVCLRASAYADTGLAGMAFVVASAVLGFIVAVARPLIEWLNSSSEIRPVRLFKRASRFYKVYLLVLMFSVPLAAFLFSVFGPDI